MSSIGRRVGAVCVATGVMLAWAGDHYALGELSAIIAVWLIAFGAMELVVAHRKFEWLWATLFAFVLTLAFVLVGLAGIDVPVQEANCAVLSETVASSGVVPVSIVDPPRLAFTCSTVQHGVVFRRFNRIDIWGVLSQHQQKAVFDSLQRIHSSEHTAPIHVTFWQKENWGDCPVPNPPGAHCRGPELVIREAIVN